MALAVTREKRVNAGNRMSRMIQEEEKDEFYKTTYGGFEEVKEASLNWSFEWWIYQGD